MANSNIRALLCVLVASVAAGQTPSQKPSPEPADEVVKIYTELRQTDVTVFDPQGKLVDGLSRENFELRIDGKPAPITFFERVEAGSGSEEVQWLASRQQRAPKETATSGRKVLFFVDDIHLSPTSIDQARRLISKYIDYEQTENDEAQIVSASGRVGFFQQLTDNKTVLRHALTRLTPYQRSGKDFGVPPISEYQAFQIDRGDTDTLNYFVDEEMKKNRLMTRAVATELVRGRAADIMRQASYWILKSLQSLDSLIRDSANVPGRKMLFFISDGFLINPNYNDMSNALRTLGTAAARAGVVIYSIDARGLGTTLLDDATGSDPSARLLRSSQGEIFAFQDPLNSLAQDSGGRTLFNHNDLYAAVQMGLKETSVYYLLGWTPERAGETSNKNRRLEVAVIGRPELTVRLRKAAFNVESVPKSAKESKKPQTTEAKLQDALVATSPAREIPLAMALSYLDTPDKGASLSVLMEIPMEALSSDANEGKLPPSVDLAGAVFDQEGKSTSNFGQKITLAEALKSNGRKLTYTHNFFSRPGLYQVRVAARDALSGRVGTAKSWIEIPDLSAKKLTLSSIVVGERVASNMSAPIDGGRLFSEQAPLSITRRLRRDSFLRCLVFVYNATYSPDRLADVAIQVQVLRNNQPVVTTGVKPLATQRGQDQQRLPYATELPLKELTAGRYILSITAIDRAGKTSASQQVRFDVQ